MLLWLTDPTATDPTLTGGKGANLARLVQWGLPVPPGFVVPVTAFQPILAAVDAPARLRALAGETVSAAQLQRLADDLRQMVRERALPPDLVQAIVAAYRHLAPQDEPVAVRSSALGEDSQTASFAGQQETYLNVCGPAAVVARVRDCLASLFLPRALFYRLHRQHQPTLGLAVVVQRMVQPRAAGILFTVDPVQGRPQVVVEAVPGLGEALASGAVTPDHYAVDRATGAVVATYIPPREGREAPAGLLTAGDLRALVDLGLRVERLFGQPQDIEWAIADRLYLLQSRPITTLRRSGHDGAQPAG